MQEQGDGQRYVCEYKEVSANLSHATRFVRVVTCGEKAVANESLTTDLV